MAHAETPQAIPPALDAEIERAAALLARARHAVALTGAGLSVESGIPPFRGPGGIWERYGEPPMDGYQRFLRDPVAGWRERLAPSEAWMVALVEALRAAKPNPGHRALAELEAEGRLASLITQNVDDLHRQAGSRAVLEIHGNWNLLRCVGCGQRFAPGEITVDPEHLPPWCPSCGSLVKSDIVLFGEPIPADVMMRCQQEARRADVMLVAGTSATVYPAAELPLEVLRRGGALVEVNPEPTDLSPLAAVSLRGPAGAVLARLAERVRAHAAGEAAP